MYPDHNLTDYTVQMVAGKLYIFGGSYERAAIGCNLLCALDVTCGEWTHLSGTIEPRADYSCPGPRKWPASWVNKAQDTIYIMHGMVDRPAARMKNQAHSEEEGHGCLDFWSWHIPTRKWRQERINGNPPTPRAEGAFTYVSIDVCCFWSSLIMSPRTRPWIKRLSSAGIALHSPHSSKIGCTVSLTTLTRSPSVLTHSPLNTS
jgi:hypothetical protein